ncbi:hypothetical protein, partial [Salinivibrio sp. IB643]|uniref:hypothetical protein n=1 Tax=Salinivibrio sp. IB643 TaxID=1909445 RepID=UPI0009C5CAC7
ILDILEFYSGKEFILLSLLKRISLCIENNKNKGLLILIEETEEIEIVKNTLMESIPIAKIIVPEVKKDLESIEGSDQEKSLKTILTEINHTTLIYRTLSQFNPLSDDDVSDIILDIDIEEKYDSNKTKLEIDKAIEKIEKKLE